MKLKVIVVFILSIIISSCQTEEIKEPKKVEQKKESLETKIKHHVETMLSIPATENYRLQIYTEHLNADDSLDRIITVNRLELAKNEAIKKERLAKSAATGFPGRYNFFFFLDGKTGEFSPAIPVPSSAMAELDVSFENIITNSYKDILVDFRLDNACFRRFFTFLKGVPKEMFETMIFDGLGEKENEAYVIRYDEGSYSLAKDILIYKGKLEQTEFENPMDVFTYKPKIDSTDQLLRRWFFNVSDYKYYTKKD